MDALELGRQMLEYCRKYKIPQDYVMDILNDQKVVPTIRGKATEYAVELLLRDILPAREWVVAKLNLNAQSGTHDEDVTVTHQRTGIIIKVECKNAVRGSFKYSTRARIKEPFCTVKCHRSRSDLSKASTTNDRYLVGDFDFVITNLSNAVIAGATYSENFELIPDTRTVGRLCEHYGCDATYEALFEATYEDWRFAKAEDIAVDGVIPRTPAVRLENDPVWRPISEIEQALLDFTRTHRARMRRR